MTPSVNRKMNKLTITLLTILLFSCNAAKKEKDIIAPEQMDLESLAFEGISVDFQFNSKKPTFGSLFLVVGYENPNFPPQSREFEKLQDLDFEQVDDYFGIRNRTELGDDVKMWLFPIINGEEVYHDDRPFDAIRLTYVVVRNTSNTKLVFEKVFNSILENLDVTPTFNGKEISRFSNIDKIINKTILYCRKELKVEPGSSEAMQLDW